MIVKPDRDFGLRALTVKQPHASAILSGAKPIEFRTWTTDYRGDLLITASANPKTKGPHSCTICVVELWDVRMGQGAEWYLRNPRAVKAVPVLGKLSLWTVSPALVKALGLTLGEADDPGEATAAKMAKAASR
jgi:hypothetical protein